MQTITRMHLASCGFRTAWYDGITFNLTDPDTELPTDTLINLENGGGKTTLLGLVFSCFETSQERFLKHIQNKHNSFSQYFTPDGVPGFILVEWLMPSRTAGGRPYRLVVGQVVCVRTTTETDVDRMFFSFEEQADLSLDDIPAPGLKGASVNSMNEFSRWIHDQQKKYPGNVFISHNRQAEWQRHLKDDRLIDLDMLRMQVNFSAEEGGFDKGFLDFKTESEFLRKFLLLTSDMTKADEARRSVVSVCDRHRRKPQLQRRRDELKKFRISLTAFAEAARLYMDAVATQKTMLIQGALLVQALQGRAADFKKAQGDELAFKELQLRQMADAMKESGLYNQEWITGTWVLYQKRVALAKQLKEAADKRTSGLETQEKLLRAARLQREIVDIDARLKELHALREAEVAELKPARDHVEIQGALLRRALFTEESRLKEELGNLATQAKLREERKTTLRAQRLNAEGNEVRLNREQSGLQAAEEHRNGRRRVLEQDGTFNGPDETAEEALERHDAAMATHVREREAHRVARDNAQAQARQHRMDANGERVKAAGFDEQAKALQAFIAKGEAELERLGQLPALLSAAENDRVDPQSPALPPRLHEVIAVSSRQVSLSDVRLAELRATRQAIEDTGVAGYSVDVTLVVQTLQAAGVRSARAFNEYIARTVPDAAKAQALVLSDPGRYAGVCVAQAEFAKAAGVAWSSRKPIRPVMVSIASLDAGTPQDDRLVVPPEDASAFNIEAAARLGDNLDARKVEEEERRAAYELRHAQTLRAAQELETFAATYGSGKLPEAAIKRFTLEEDATTARARADNLETDALALDEKTDQHAHASAEAERLRGDAERAAKAVRQFQAEHETGRNARLVRLADIGQELAEAREQRAEVDVALEQLQEAHDADQTKRANAEVDMRQVGEERGRIALYSKDYPAQEQLQGNPRPLSTLRQLYADAFAVYQTEEKARLGSLHERIEGVNEQRLSKTGEFTREFSGVNMAELKPFLEVNHTAELATTQQQLQHARHEQVEASAQYTSVHRESQTWYGSNKQHLGQATSDFERLTPEELEPKLTALQRQVDAALERMRTATEEAEKAKSRAEEKQRNAEADEQAEGFLRNGMGLPDQPDPSLIAAEIGALTGAVPEVPDMATVVLELHSSKQVNALMKEYNGKNSGVAKLQAAARTAFDALKTAAGDATFQEVDPDVALQMRQNDFTAACTDAPRLLEHLDDRISTTESTLATMQADFDTCVEEVLGVVRAGISTLNRACSSDKCVPPTAPYVGGKQVLKMKANFAAVTLEMRRAAMRNYLDMLADTAAIPAKGTDLIADAIVRVYGKPLGLQVLKMSIEETEQYVAVEKISNSGGEGVVMAMFLYLVINQLRAENHAQVQKIAGGPLILDNPFAKATTAALWRAQRLLASAMNVQLIFATALQDFNSIGEFQRFIRLRKAGQNNKTKRWHLEVANLQLNEAADEVSA
jgi:hypothetical protein